MAVLPTGTVTFLFTDIEGSTRLLSELGAELYDRALSRHRAILRDAFGAHDGVVVDTEGDAFFVVFARATDALAAASDLVDALEDGPIRVRVGIHTGEPLLTDQGYVGIDVHRGARIAAAGHGGQILVSQTTRDLAPGAEFRDLGEHRLKDLTVPERLYQLGEGEFPALKSRKRTNLPLVAGPFFGREQELAEAARLIGEGVRLLTVTGPGGSGKTRLALELAAEHADDYPDGVFFVALAPLGDADLVPGTIAAAVGLPADDDLLAAIASRRALLVLDNAEHLDVAEFVGTLLDTARQVTVLVTSRAPLHLSLECQLEIESLAETSAVELFVARAALVGRAVTPDERTAAVCNRLDCLPLAIELAAARIKLLSVPSLLERLEHSLALLSGVARDAPERHRTLRATIQWSYDLLDGVNQRTFGRLAVFRGGFTDEAAMAITGADLDGLAALLDQSLLKRVGDDRYLMLETIREFAYEQLGSAAEAAEVAERHGRWYLDKLREFAPILRGPRTTQLFAWYDEEVGNTWLALDELRVCDLDAALEMADELAPYWVARGRMREGRGWLLSALSEDERPTVARARAMARLANICAQLGDFDDAEEAGREAAELGEQVGDALATVRALHDLGFAKYLRGDAAAAEPFARRAVALAMEHGISPQGHATNLLALVLTSQGNHEEAQTLFERNLAIYSAAGDSMNVAITQGNLAHVAFVSGRYSDARERGNAAVEIFVKLHNVRSSTGIYGNLAFADVADGDDLAAVRHATVGLTHASESGLVVETCLSAAAIAVAARTADPAAAERLWHAALVRLASKGSGLDPFQLAAAERLMSSARADFGSSTSETATQSGAHLTDEEILALALELGVSVAAQPPAAYSSNSDPQRPV